MTHAWNIPPLAIVDDIEDPLYCLDKFDFIDAAHVYFPAETATHKSFEKEIENTEQKEKKKRERKMVERKSEIKISRYYYPFPYQGLDSGSRDSAQFVTLFKRSWATTTYIK